MIPNTAAKRMKLAFNHGKPMLWQQSLMGLIGLIGLMMAVRAGAQTCVPAPSGLVSWWPGDGDPNDIIGPNNGTLHGTATFAKGLVGQAFSFDGSGAFVDAATVGLPIGSSNRTLEMWIRINRYVPDVEEAFFAGYGAFGSFNQVYVLGAVGPNPVRQPGMFFSQWGTGVAGPVLATGTWYHIAVTNVGDQVTLYLNGDAVNKGAVPIMTASNTRFDMGSIPLPFGDIRRLDGLVDEVSIYNRVLSPAEIHSIYDAGSAGKCHTVMDVDVQGNLTMRDSTSLAVGNILKNGVPFIHNFGTLNTFIGSSAGNLTMTGFENTGNGAGALGSNTRGYNNTADGVNALFFNTTGVYNTATGSNALQSNTSGGANTASGVFTLYNNTTGFSNTASGVSALYSNTTGGTNTATGVQTLQFNTSGNFNSANGAYALSNNTTGSENTAAGYLALIGNTIGFRNTAAGRGALFTNTTGSDNTAVGVGADVSAGNLINATAIGAGAVVNASNKIRLGNTQVTVVEGPPYSVVSDRNEKENFRPLDAEEVLAKLRGLSVTSWNYKGQNAKQFRHYGPMAQDFYAAFGDDGIGRIGTPTTISSGDLDGILMVAARALEKRTAEQEKRSLKQGKEMDALRAENADLKARLDALERRFATGLVADPKGNVR